MDGAAVTLAGALVPLVEPIMGDGAVAVVVAAVVGTEPDAAESDGAVVREEANESCWLSGCDAAE